MNMTQHGMNLKNPLAPLPTERMAQNCRHLHQRKPKIAVPASKPKPSKKRKPYFYNPADRD